MRNPNGFGCVFKLNGNRRKPYVARITTGWTDEGKQQYKNIGTFSHYKEAVQALADYHTNPYNLDTARITLSEVYEKWSKDKYPKISISMVRSYKNAYKSCEPLYNEPLCSIKKFQMQELINNSGKTYSGRERMKMLFSQLFNFGIENDIVSKNYSNYVDLGAKDDKSIIRMPYTYEEIKLLYKSLHVYKYIDTILMMAFTGVRPSELLLTETKNVFLNENYFVCGIKNETSYNRKVPISKLVKPFFEKYYNEAISKGSKFLIMNTEGSNMKYSNYNRDKFHKIMEQLEMKHTPHDGRHTFATYMEKCNANKLSTQLIMGHSPKVLIDKVYTHKTLEDLQIEINKLETLFSPDNMLSLIDKKYFDDNYEFLTFSSSDNLLKRNCS
ncbi:MAG: site-specific integrase [Clostridia bacterium]|nr:site-specific integrase [Clostridia bacterium]